MSAFLFATASAHAARVAVPGTPAGAQQFVDAIKTPSVSIGTPTFDVTPGASAGVSDSPISKLPSNGTTFGILSSGFATGGDAGFSNTSNVRNALDVTIVRIPLTVPAGAQCLSLDFQSYSSDTNYREGLIAEIDTSDWAASGAGTANTTGVQNFATNANGQPVTAVDGTFSSAQVDGAGYTVASARHTARTPITPGSHVLYLSMYDRGDNVGPSASFVDNLRTTSVACAKGASLAPTVTITNASGSASAGTPHTTTASAVDGNGAALANVPVKFTVTGANPTVQTVSTNTSGVATFTQTGVNPGTDNTIASYDADGDNDPEAISRGQQFTYTQPTVAANNVNITEGNIGTFTGTFTVSLNAASTQTTTVDYATVNGTASSNSDYTAASGTLTFAPGETTKTVAVSVNGDELVENNETVSLALSNGQGLTPAGNGTLTINNDDVPALSTVSTPDSDITEGDSGTATGSVRVRTNLLSANPITVDYTTVDGVATAPTDYVGAVGTATIPAGESFVDVPVTVNGDQLVEPTESFTVNISNPSVGAIDDTAANADVNITNDDTASLSINNTAVIEGDTGTVNATLTVSTDKTSTSDITVNVATADDSAVQPSDYTATTATLTIPAGQTSATVTVPVIGDQRVEGDQTFNAVLSNATGSVVDDGTGVVTITDDDAAVVSLSGSTVTEGDTGSVETNVTATTNRESESAITVEYTTENGSATASTQNTTGDYEFQTGTITIPAGQTSATAPFQVNGDELVENNEAFAVQATDAGGATLDTDADRASVIITDDDTAVLSAADVSVNEGSTADVTVTSSRTSDSDIAFHYTTEDGTAVTPGDYTAAEGTVTIPAGETTATLSIPTIDNAIATGNKAFKVVLDSPVGATVNNDTATVTVVDDEAATLSISDVDVVEGDTGTTEATATVTASVASEAPVTVKYATQDANASAPTDYVAAAGELTFAPGETSKTVKVAINGDNTVEDVEQFNIRLSDATNASINDDKGVVTITDNDGTPVLSADNVSLDEGNTTAIVSAQVPVTLNKPSSKDVRVNYHTENGTADDNDYAGKGGTLVIPAGETSAKIPVGIKTDKKFESDEQFSMIFDGPANAELATPSVKVTIKNDDKKFVPQVCTSNRKFTIHLRPTTRPLKSANVTVNGKKVSVKKSKSGRYTAVIDLRGKKAGTKVVVKTVTVDRRNRVTRETRTYRPCAGKK